MKKTITLFLCFALIFALASCGAAQSDEEQTTGNQQHNEPETSAPVDDSDSSGTHASGGNVLIAYFSWADNAVIDGEVDAVSSPSVLSPGNVQQLAGWVQEKTGGDLFSIRVTEAYPSDWDDCLARANDERGEDARPELAENVADISRYDTVFIGYPNWWYGVPMALLSFLDNNDLSGKQVYLFCSHGTGGLASSVEIITEALPDADISGNVFDCYEEDAAGSREEIESWLAELGY